ncbi:DUF4158 domain-containing protein [Nonomuraea jiangxiensis]|uniref:DUF4158 domain-containing protein n=1 Tax=Nonomuraea jiangxiensis TaxID=633440 RepID=UPI003CCBC6CC
MTSREHAFLDAPGRGPEARLGLAVQLCTLAWLGYIPDDLQEVRQPPPPPPPTVRQATGWLLRNSAALTSRSSTRPAAATPARSTTWPSKLYWRLSSPIRPSSTSPPPEPPSTKSSHQSDANSATKRIVQ